MGIRKYSVMISGHQTSISLEPEFWNELKRIAEKNTEPFSALVKRIDDTRLGGLSSALRLYVLQELKNEASQPNKEHKDD